MGCEESRPAGTGGKTEQQPNYYTLNAAFQGGNSDEAQLRPIDVLDHQWRSSLPEASYGAWDVKKIELDGNLKLLEKKEVTDYATTA